MDYPTVPATPIPASPSAVKARLANATRFGAPPEVLDGYRRNYHAARCAERLRELLASDYAPTPGQRRELAFLLLAGGDADGAAA